MSSRPSVEYDVGDEVIHLIRHIGATLGMANSLLSKYLRAEVLRRHAQNPEQSKATFHTSHPGGPTRIFELQMITYSRILWGVSEHNLAPACEAVRVQGPAMTHSTSYYEKLFDAAHLTIAVIRHVPRYTPPTAALQEVQFSAPAKETVKLLRDRLQDLCRLRVGYNDGASAGDGGWIEISDQVEGVYGASPAELEQEEANVPGPL